MRAAVFNADTGRVDVEDIPMPAVGKGDVLIRVCRCGICGSDVSRACEAAFPYGSGQFGHEYSGEVIEVGRDAAGIRVGDHVAVMPVAACGQCAWCKWGNALLCQAPKSATFGFGEYAAVPGKVAIRLPSAMSFADGALVEPMACGLHALRDAGFRPGDRVLVLGAGSMALSAIFWARRMGAGKVVALSRSARRQDVAMGMGADAMFGFGDEDRARIFEALGGPADIAVECVGKAGMLSRAMEQVRPRGTAISMGMCMTMEPLIPFMGARKEVRLTFPIGYTADEFAETARAFDCGAIPCDAMVSEVIGLENLPACLNDLRSGKMKSLKVQVDPARKVSLV